MSAFIVAANGIGGFRRVGGVWMLVVPLLGCTRDVTQASGGSAASSVTLSANAATSSASSTTTQGAGGASSCLSWSTETDCKSAGCDWLSADLYPPTPNGPPVCQNAMAIGVCTRIGANGFGSPTVYRRDTPQGRIVVGYDETSLEGFADCSTLPSATDECLCFP